MHRGVLRNPSNCRPHLAASPRTNRLSAIISPSTGLAHPMPVRVLSTEARPPGGQPCIRSSGAAFAIRRFEVPPCAAFSATGLARPRIPPSRARPDIQSSYLSPGLAPEDPLRGDCGMRGLPLRVGG